MGTDYPFELLEDPVELARLGEWNAEVYRDFDAYRSGRLSEAEFRAKYVTRVAIFCLDMTGFTKSAIRYGEIESLLRIYDVQKVCLPVLRTFDARLTRAFADDLTALFDDPHHALEAALEIHRRIGLFNGSAQATPHPAHCCIGIGFGDVFAIGPDLAMGDEMNRASKLGEDTARANETLLTENMYEAVKDRRDCGFEQQSNDDLIFPFYSVVPAAP